MRLVFHFFVIIRIRMPYILHEVFFSYAYTVVNDFAFTYTPISRINSQVNLHKLVRCIRIFMQTEFPSFQFKVCGMCVVYLQREGRERQRKKHIRLEIFEQKIYTIKMCACKRQFYLLNLYFWHSAIDKAKSVVVVKKCSLREKRDNKIKYIG